MTRRRIHSIALLLIACILFINTGNVSAESATAELSLSVAPAKGVSMEAVDVVRELRSGGVIRYTMTFVVADGRCISPTNCTDAANGGKASPGWRFSAAVSKSPSASSIHIENSAVKLVGVSNLCRASDAPCSMPWDGGQAIDVVHGPVPTIAGVSTISKATSLIAAEPGYGNGVYLFTVIIDVQTTTKNTPSHFTFTVANKF